MNESFLHYIWQFQYFDKNALTTTDGEAIIVYKQGHHNTDSGPDFSNAKIKIGTIEWAGHVEIHINASAWNEHRHQHDDAYNNVILHVVWQNDKPIFAKDGSRIPTLELKNRIAASLIHHYHQLINTSSVVPCKQSLPQVNDITRLSMSDRVLVERLQSKSQWIRDVYSSTGNDWEEATYQLLARNFGFKVNNDPFLLLAQRLPYKLILKQSSSIQVEALIFGMAGFLEAGMKDDYFNALQREFKQHQTKYRLEDKVLNPAQWRFLRLRPANFPTIRLAQFSALLSKSRSLFSSIIEAASYADLVRLFTTSQSAYWQNHYRFGKKSNSTISALGDASIDSLIINSVAPLLTAYGIERDEPSYIDRAQEILQQIPAEANTITRIWDQLNWKVKTAFDSQALTELYTHYCKRRNCLNCSIGASILRPNAQ
ncbi:MAG: DUF2851 domain-containing protein [Azospira oryzae]|jgi:hypothetical protein|nr:MAG: DUF2851 domain-containing protein [Azospira oryzae]